MVGSVVCTVYMDGQRYKPCVLCRTGLRELNRLLPCNSLSPPSPGHPPRWGHKILEAL